MSRPKLIIPPPCERLSNLPLATNCQTLRASPAWAFLNAGGSVAVPRHARSLQLVEEGRGWRDPRTSSRRGVGQEVPLVYLEKSSFRSGVYWIRGCRMPGLFLARGRSQRDPFGAGPLPSKRANCKLRD